MYTFHSVLNGRYVVFGKKRGWFIVPGSFQDYGIWGESRVFQPSNHCYYYDVMYRDALSDENRFRREFKNRAAAIKWLVRQDLQAVGKCGEEGIGIPENISRLEYWRLRYRWEDENDLANQWVAEILTC